MENVTTRGNLADSGTSGEGLHADDTLRGCKLVDFFTILDDRDKLAVAVDKRCMLNPGECLSILLSHRTVAASLITHLYLLSTSLGRQLVASLGLCIHIGIDLIHILLLFITVDSAFESTTPEPETHSAASHAQAAQQDHHQEHGDLL